MAQNIDRINMCIFNIRLVDVGSNVLRNIGKQSHQKGGAIPRIGIGLFMSQSGSPKISFSQLLTFFL
jgi:hypothetical protein